MSGFESWGLRDGSGLREFISSLDERRMLERVTVQTNWRHEVGRLTRASQAPVLFTKVKGYPSFYIFCNGLSSPRAFALALGVDRQNMSFVDLVRFVRSRCGAIAPSNVSGSSPWHCERYGSRVDLSELPVPWWHPADADRYIGTWHINVSADPETGRRNVGVYRMQIVDETHTTVSVSPRSDLAQHMAAAERRGMPLNMAVAIGVPEVAVMAGAAAAPSGVDEYGLAGALAREPLELRPCTTMSLWIPAQSEILLEGRLIPEVRVPDGPFMDYAGVPNVNERALLFEVRYVAWRNRPVFRGASVGTPGAEDHLLFAVLAHCELADFHGSRMRRRLQNALLRRRWFRLLQMSGRLGHMLHYGSRDRTTREVSA